MIIQNIWCASLREDLYICAMLVSGLAIWFVLVNEMWVEMMDHFQAEVKRQLMVLHVLLWLPTDNVPERDFPLAWTSDIDG